MASRKLAFAQVHKSKMDNREYLNGTADTHKVKKTRNDQTENDFRLSPSNEMKHIQSITKTAGVEDAERPGRPCTVWNH